jgi:hypothetical protein
MSSTSCTFTLTTCTFLYLRIARTRRCTGGSICPICDEATLDRRAIRRHFEARFSAERMARNYLSIYEGLRGGESRGFGSGVMRAPNAEAAD